MTTHTLDRETVRRHLGDVDDATAADIIATGASEKELIEAGQWAAGSTRPAREAGKPLGGTVARVVEILVAEQHQAADDPERP